MRIFLHEPYSSMAYMHKYAVGTINLWLRSKEKSQDFVEKSQGFVKTLRRLVKLSKAFFQQSLGLFQQSLTSAPQSHFLAQVRLSKYFAFFMYEKTALVGGMAEQVKSILYNQDILHGSIVDAVAE